MIVSRDRVHPTTRTLAAVIVPFLLVGVYVLYLRTGQTRSCGRGRSARRCRR
jgi:hypothetical protein